MDKVDIDTVLDALGDANRRSILRKLAAGPLDVTGIALGMPVGRPAVSMHLRVLRDAGLVADHPVGNRRVYQLDPAGFHQLREYLDQYWERSLLAFQEAAETRAKEGSMSAEEEVLVEKRVVVRAPLAVAFDVFVDHQWWPVATHHIAHEPGVRAVLEPFLGGRWFEVASNGTETDWGVVRVWQPPHRILLTWQVSPQWTYEPDPLNGSEIEVTFTSQGPDETLVRLVHRRLERYGEQSERMRSVLDEKGGAPLEAFARFLEQQSTILTGGRT